MAPSTIFPTIKEPASRLSVKPRAVKEAKVPSPPVISELRKVRAHATHLPGRRDQRPNSAFDPAVAKATHPRRSRCNFAPRSRGQRGNTAALPTRLVNFGATTSVSSTRPIKWKRRPLPKMGENLPFNLHRDSPHCPGPKPNPRAGAPKTAPGRMRAAQTTIGPAKAGGANLPAPRCGPTKLPPLPFSKHRFAVSKFRRTHSQTRLTRSLKIQPEATTAKEKGRPAPCFTGPFRICLLAVSKLRTPNSTLRSPNFTRPQSQNSGRL
jgi:hypothetical protein